jgi:epsilon-lactone hydrolase
MGVDTILTVSLMPAMHSALRAAGVPAELHILEAAPRTGFFGAPEDAALEREIRHFVDAHWQ